MNALELTTRPRAGLGRVVAVTVLMLLAVVALTGSAGADEYSDGADAVWMVNTARSSDGVAPVTADSELQAVAQRWAEHMAADGFITHNSNLGNELGWTWSAWAENVGYGPSVGWIHGAFLNSPHHAQNMLEPAYGYIGVGVAYGGDGRVYVTQLFGA